MDNNILQRLLDESSGYLVRGDYCGIKLHESGMPTLVIVIGNLLTIEVSDNKNKTIVKCSTPVNSKFCTEFSSSTPLIGFRAFITAKNVRETIADFRQFRSTPYGRAFGELDEIHSWETAQYTSFSKAIRKFGYDSYHDFFDTVFSLASQNVFYLDVYYDKHTGHLQIDFRDTTYTFGYASLADLKATWEAVGLPVNSLDYMEYNNAHVISMNFKVK